MTLTRKPGTYLTESVETTYIKKGGKIPCFIAVTDTTDTSKTGHPEQIIKGESQSQLYEEILNKTSITSIDKLYCKKELDEFYTEMINYRNPEEAGVNMVYFIDVGAGTQQDTWKTALNTCMSLSDVKMMVFLGLSQLSTGEGFLTESVANTLSVAAKNFDFRTCYFTVAKVGFVSDTDEKLIDYVKNITDSRLFEIEPNQFGKSLGRICVTPFWREVGHNDFSTVPADTFDYRTDEKITLLMNSGVNVGLDETVGELKHTRLNYLVSTAFKENPHHVDSVLQARLISDEFLEALQAKLYPYLKANETETTLTYMQLDADALVDEWIRKEYLKPGSECTIEAAKDNIGTIYVQSSIIPINAITAIEVRAVIKQGIITEEEEE